MVGDDLDLLTFGRVFELFSFTFVLSVVVRWTVHESIPLSFLIQRRLNPIAMLNEGCHSRREQMVARNECVGEVQYLLMFKGVAHLKLEGCRPLVRQGSNHLEVNAV
jgi:hypothetical protein